MSSKKTDEPSKEPGNGSDELTAVVEELLDSLSTKFTTVSSEIFAKMDEMTRRLDSLESALQASEEKLSNAASKQQ
ncbi:heat shock factor binding protein 1-domain-containing protein [Annulohypoxylon maeteangense]|uniref:heat shock factor binding protein 1-domain-containing protein n=1 Tax=Annulohypoxylon maeteangense TaxID=1927788 RepID=UPI002008D1A4|nr:heat shock factor binding protein 1-domain-containing protein [Annulohypoxylon maeteangense]KAI0883225.1 heat shock factor binding protein 1-domain-containing protein [Annulohypoxylon maeteangense]